MPMASIHAHDGCHLPRTRPKRMFSFHALGAVFVDWIRVLLPRAGTTSSPMDEEISSRLAGPGRSCRRTDRRLKSQ